MRTKPPKKATQLELRLFDKQPKRCRTKPPKQCEHPLDRREWRQNSIVRALACTACNAVLRTIARCSVCGTEMIANGQKGYGGVCIFVECPRGHGLPMLWNRNAYYGSLMVPLKPNERENQERKPVFAFVGLEEKPTHRWHYGRQEWTDIRR